jgi:hypothetical protein
MMPPHAAFAAAPSPGIPPAAANVMHGMPLGFNPMPSPGASSPMKPAEMPPVAMFRPDAGGAPGSGVQQPGSAAGAVVGGSGGELVKKKRGRPRKYGPDGSIGLGYKPVASTESGGGGANSNPDGKRRGRPPGSGKKKQLDALGNIALHHLSALDLYGLNSQKSVAQCILLLKSSMACSTGKKCGASMWSSVFFH